MRMITRKQIVASVAVVLLVALFFSISGSVYAQEPFYGSVEPPEFLKRFMPDDVAGGPLIMLFNIILRLLLVVAGFYAIWNFVQAGYTFMNAAGDPEKLALARDQIVLTVVGLLVMASALVLAGVIGIIFYGEWDAIINPTITGAPQDTTP